MFGDLIFRKKNLLTELMGLDAREESVGLLNEDQNRRIQLKGDIEHLASLKGNFLVTKVSCFVCEGGR